MITSFLSQVDYGGLYLAHITKITIVIFPKINLQGRYVKVGYHKMIKVEYVSC